MYLSPAPVLGFDDNNGVPLVGGKLFIYAAGSTTKQAAFTDAGGNTALPNPIILNLRGEVAPSATGASSGLWLDPSLSYKLILSPSTDTDPPTNPYWTVDNIVSPQSAILAALTQYEAMLGGVPIGAMMPFAGSSAPTGWQLCYGQALSRTTFALLFAIIGTAYGAGDGSTTFNVPDKRGRISIGKDDMGGSAANRVTNAVSGITGTTLGATGGSQLAQQDTLSVSSSATSVVTDPGHMHNFDGSGTAHPPLVFVGTGGNSNIVGGSQVLGKVMLNANTGVSVATSVTTTVTSTLTGASQNMPPGQMDNQIIFAGV